MPPHDQHRGLDELSRAIGALESQVEANRRQLERLTDVLKDDQKIHGSTIFDIKESVTAIHNSVTELSVALTGVGARVAKIEPEIKHYTEFRYTSKGAVWAFRTMFFGAAAIAGAIGTKLLNKFWP